MARKHRQEAAENHERWLVSYADFITLLFAFFVVMFATSQTDRSKAQQVSDSVNKALEGQSFSAAVASVLGGTVSDKGQGNAQMKGPGGADKVSKPEKVVELLPSLKILRKELDQEIKDGRIEVSMQPRGLTISFQQAAFFPSGGDEIAPDTYSSIQKVASAMQRIPNPARLEGHTDAIPIHNSRFRSNWELSAARSIALLELLASRFGVSRDRISIAGYAETVPAASNQTDVGRARNRRVDIVLLNQTGVMGEPERYTPNQPAH
ncbi:MAG: flagellar motor protein MotB [Bryobacteraceae bacterium]